MFHAWLAAGIAVEAPERSLPSATHVLIAELERVVAPMAADTKPAGESALADPATPLSLRAHGQPVTERFLPAAQRGKSGAAQDTSDPAPTPAAALALPPTADLTYYPASELDVYPAPRAPLRFEYPERAVHENVGGGVRIMLLLDEAGAIDGVTVVAAEPPGFFEASVRAGFAAARFFPARKNGRAVKSRVLINVNYDPAAAEGALR